MRRKPRLARRLVLPTGPLITPACRAYVPHRFYPWGRALCPLLRRLARGQSLIWTPPHDWVTYRRMTDQPVPDPDSGIGKPAKSQRAQHRENRLKAALKANMAKRKQQMRGRAEDDTTGNHNDKE